LTTANLPMPSAQDGYGHARTPRGNAAAETLRIDRVEYGRFRNVYLYITEACQLRCEHCYMGERLDRALKMPLSQIVDRLTTWRRMGGTKLTLLGGEPTLHPNFTDAVRLAGHLGYEHVITTTNAQSPALRKFRRMSPQDFAYVQVSLDGGSSASHDAVRGARTFDAALATTAELTERGFDTASSAPSARPTAPTPCAFSTSPTNSVSAWSSTTCSRPSGPGTATRTLP
jgi:sulfatase maturation enzyme AslB (radical SAM superfamily)